MKWPHHRNLRNRPPTPSMGRGPVQRAIRRAFAASDTEVLTSSEITFAVGWVAASQCRSVSIRVRDRADEPLRSGEIGSFQESGLSCVAGDDFDAPRAEPVDDPLLDDQERLPSSRVAAAETTSKSP
jgi:hypothetical protein